MLYNKRKGIVIQIKPTSYKKGDDTKAITIYDEDVLIAFTRITEMYKQVEDKRK